MKKLILSTVLLLTFTITYAQFNFGIKAGYNSSLSFDNISSVTNGSYNLNTVQSEMWNNFQAGLFARVFLGKVVYIQPELLYSVQKKDYQVNFQDVTAGAVTLDKFANISTVDIPILLGLKLLDLKLLNVRAFAGPKLRFNSGSTFDFQNITGGNFNTNQIVTDVKAANLGLEVGAGIDVLMFALDVRYNLISDMYTTKIGDINLQNLPSNTFVISLGWKIF